LPPWPHNVPVSPREAFRVASVFPWRPVEANHHVCRRHGARITMGPAPLFSVTFSWGRFVEAALWKTLIQSPAAGFWLTVVARTLPQKKKKRRESDPASHGPENKTGCGPCPRFFTAARPASRNCSQPRRRQHGLRWPASGNIKEKRALETCMNLPATPVGPVLHLRPCARAAH